MTAKVRRVLTEKFCAAVKPPAIGRAMYLDAVVPGLALRVTSTGHKSFVLSARYPGASGHSARRSLGAFSPAGGGGLDATTLRAAVAALQASPGDPAAVAAVVAAAGGRGPQDESTAGGSLTLAEARDKARLWLDMKARGIDPRTADERRRAKPAAVITFGTVAEAHFDFQARGGKVTAAEGRRTVERACATLLPRAVNSIRPEEVAAIVRELGARAPYQAHNLLAYLKRLFGWAVASHAYGLETSPAERLKPNDLIGRREARDRVLSDNEIRLVWSAANLLGPPYGPLVQMLFVTAARLNSVATMRWDWVDLGGATLEIPAAHIKMAVPFVLPLPKLALGILAAMPRLGPYVFTSTGARPVNDFSRVKARLDKLLPADMPHWTFHDIRRTARTRFSAIHGPGITDLVREKAIAHQPGGIAAVYNRYEYMAELRELFDKWSAVLEGILAGPAVGATVRPLVPRSFAGGAAR